MPQEISRIPGITLAFQSTGTFDGVTDISATVMRRADPPQTQTYLGEPAAAMGVLNVYTALNGIRGAIGLGLELPIAVGNVVPAFLLKRLTLVSGAAFGTRTVTHRRRTITTTPAIDIANVFEVIPATTITATFATRYNYRILEPGDELVLTDDAASSLLQVEIELIPVTDAGTYTDIGQARAIAGSIA